MVADRQVDGRGDASGIGEGAGEIPGVGGGVGRSRMPSRVTATGSPSGGGDRLVFAGVGSGEGLGNADDDGIAGGETGGAADGEGDLVGADREGDGRVWGQWRSQRLPSDQE